MSAERLRQARLNPTEEDMAYAEGFVDGQDAAYDAVGGGRILLAVLAAAAALVAGILIGLGWPR